MVKYVVGGMAVILVIAGGYYFLKGEKAAPVDSTPTSGTVVQMATSTYATSTYSVVYPQDFTLDTAYTYTQVNPKKPISGTKFSVPLTVATGTNLSADSYISIEQLPRAKNCTGDIYVHDNVRPTNETYNGVSYSVATTSGVGAGNFYEEYVFAVAGSAPCTAVRYFIHSTNIGNYEPGTVREFDKAALMASFDKIRDALVLVR